MRMLRWTLALVLAIGSLAGPQAAPPGQTTFTENFESGSNVGSWTFGAPHLERIEPEGGGPGAFLRNDWLDTIGPTGQTLVGESSIFTGNYRARNVLSLEIDFALFRVGYTSLDRPVSLMLRNINGTLDDWGDDCVVFHVGSRECPKPSGSWHHYRFHIPSDSPTLPEDWGVMECRGRTEDEAWNLVVGDVDQVAFFWGDPMMFYIFQMWDVGLDNPSITFGTPDPPQAE